LRDAKILQNSLVLGLHGVVKVLVKEGIKVSCDGCSR